MRRSCQRGLLISQTCSEMRWTSNGSPNHRRKDMRIPGVFTSPGHGTRDPATLRQEAMNTPPLPAGRGEIRRFAEQVAHGGSHEAPGNPNGMECGAGQFLSSQALTGNIRTYLCVSKKLWLTVPATWHPEHTRIVKCIARLIAKHKWSKDDALQARGGLLKSWPNVPDF